MVTLHRPSNVDDPANLRPVVEALIAAQACERAGQKVTIRMQPGYDHSYFFIASFVADHIAWHAARL